MSTHSHYELMFQCKLGNFWTWIFEKLLDLDVLPRLDHSDFVQGESFFDTSSIRCNVKSRAVLNCWNPVNPSSHHIFLAAIFFVTIFDSLQCKLRLQEPTLSMFSTIMGMVLGDARRHWCTLRRLNARGLNPVVTLFTTYPLTTCGEKTRNALRDEFDRF